MTRNRVRRWVPVLIVGAALVMVGGCQWPIPWPPGPPHPTTTTRPVTTTTRPVSTTTRPGSTTTTRPRLSTTVPGPSTTTITTIPSSTITTMPPGPTTFEVAVRLSLCDGGVCDEATTVDVPSVCVIEDSRYPSTVLCAPTVNGSAAFGPLDPGDYHAYVPQDSLASLPPGTTCGSADHATESDGHAIYEIPCSADRSYCGPSTAIVKPVVASKIVPVTTTLRPCPTTTGRAS